MTKILRFVRLRIFFEWWWVAAFVACVTVSYERSVQAKMHTYQTLVERKCMIEEKRLQALLDREELLLKIISQEDPRWVEMVLKKGLGVVPEGQKKVVFIDNLVDSNR